MAISFNLVSSNHLMRLEAPPAGTHFLASSTTTTTTSTSSSTAAAAQQSVGASLVELGKELLLASIDGDCPKISSLLSRGAPMTTDWLGNSPLHLAASNGHLEACEVILRSGGTKEAKTKVDKTPLHLAANNGHAGVVEFLCQSGSDPNAQDMLFMTPLHWAVENGHADTAEVLLKHGSNVDTFSKFGKCAMEIASGKNRADIFELLQNADQIRSEFVKDPAQADAATLAATQSIIQEMQGEAVGEEFDPSFVSPDQSEEQAVKLLASHGITYLPEENDDDPGTRIINSDQTYALTEAGKMALKLSHDGQRAAAVPTAVKFVRNLVASTPSSSLGLNSSSAARATSYPHTGFLVPGNKGVGGGSRVVNKPVVISRVVSVNPGGGVGVAGFQHHRVLPKTAVVVTSSSSAAASAAASSSSTYSKGQQQPTIKKVIRVSPEQYAKIKAGGITKISSFSSASPPVLTLSNGTSMLAPRTIVSASSSIAGYPAAAPTASTAAISSSSAMPSKTFKVVRVDPKTGKLLDSFSPKVLASSSSSSSTTTSTAATLAISAAGTMRSKVLNPTTSNSSSSDALKKRLAEIEAAEANLQAMLKRQQEERAELLKQLKLGSAANEVVLD